MECEETIKKSHQHNFPMIEENVVFNSFTG